MRISDWSSDVCSSDLIEEVPRPGHPDKAPAPAPPGRNLTRGPEAQQVLDREEGEQNAVQEAKGRRHLLVSPEALLSLQHGNPRARQDHDNDETGNIDASRLIRGAAVETGPEPAPYPDQNARHRRAISSLRRCRHRSEEHTSELQSLMRTSSAVFCLKKK